MERTKETNGTKRSRDDENEGQTTLPPLVRQDHVEPLDGEVVAKETDRLVKKLRVETPLRPSNSVASEEDAEAILLRALEEAIEKEAANEKALGSMIHVDEDDDYDDSD